MYFEVQRLQHTYFRLDNACGGVSKPTGRQEMLGSSQTNDTVVGAQLARQLHAGDCTENNLVSQAVFNIAPLNGTVGSSAFLNVLMELNNVVQHEAMKQFGSPVLHLWSQSKISAEFKQE